jgi:hypothetical protein
MPLSQAENKLIDAANAVIDAVPRGTVERRITDHTVSVILPLISQHYGSWIRAGL